MPVRSKQKKKGGVKMKGVCSEIFSMHEGSKGLIYSPGCCGPVAVLISWTDPAPSLGYKPDL